MSAFYQLAGMLKNAVKTPFSGWLGSTTINLNTKKKKKKIFKNIFEIKRGPA
jgi:hypothetical protein